MDKKYEDLPPDLPPDADGDYLEQKYQEKLAKEEGEKTKQSEDSSNELMLKLETLEGKLQSETERRNSTDERISRLSEEIGELRSMILERERTIGNIDAGFEKIKDQLGEVKPELIAKDLEKKEKTIFEAVARLDMTEETLTALKKELGVFREQVGKIRSFDNIIQMYDELNNKIQKIQEAEQYVNRMASKVEGIFSELDKRIPELVDVEEKTKTLQEITTDLMKSLDKDEVKLKEAVYKEDLQKLRAELEDKIKNFELGIGDSVKKVDEFGKSFMDIEKKIDTIVGIGSIDKKLEDVKSSLGVLEKNKLSLQDMDERLRKIEEQDEKLASEFKAQVKAEITRTTPKERGYELEDVVSKIRKQQLLTRNIEMEKRLHELETSVSQTKQYLEEGKFDDKPLTPKKKSEQVKIVADELRESIGNAHDLIEKKKISEAREAYLKVWDSYSKLNEACTNKSVVEPVYKDIQRLHKRISLEEKAEKVEELAKVTGELIGKNDLEGAQARYLETMDAYGEYNKDSKNIERKKELQIVLSGLQFRIEKKGGAASPVEVIKKSVSEALSLADAGKAEEANDEYMRIFEWYAQLKETDNPSAEAVYPSLDSLHKRLELEKKIGEMDGALEGINKLIDGGDLKGAQNKYLDAMGIYGEYNNASKDVGRKNSIFEKLSELHDRLDAASTES